MTFNSKRIIIIGIAVLLIVILLILKFYVFKNSEMSVAGLKPEVEIEAANLVKRFKSNENEANLKYLNKVISVKGLVNKIVDNHEEFSVYLRQMGDSSGVNCSFNRNVIRKSKLKPGDQVKIKGICNGYLMDVVLNKCVIE